MRQTTKKVVSMALVSALALTSALGGSTTSEAAAKTKKIVMNKKKVTLKVGKTFKLKVKKVTPKKASKAVTYKTNKKKIATVSKKGVIKGKKAGKATITVTSKKNKKAKAKVTVTVKAADERQVVPTIAPTSTPAASSAPNTQTAAPNQTVAPSATPVTTAPATTAPTKKPTVTQPPKTDAPPTSTPVWDGKDVDEYKFDVQKQLWTNDWYEKKNNDDGSVTLTRGKGEQGWQVGEFGFVIPRDVVGNQHKLTKIIIKYRDADLTEGTEKKCGYTFHYGDETRVEWFAEANEVPHDDAIEFVGSGEAVFEADANENNFSTVRIYDGKIGGKITIESVRLEKAEKPPVETNPPADTSTVETSTVETSTVETSSQDVPAPKSSVPESQMLIQALEPAILPETKKIFK